METITISPNIQNESTNQLSSAGKNCQNFVKITNESGRVLIHLLGASKTLCKELFKLRERREDFTVQIVPTTVGRLGGGMKELKESLKRIFEKGKDNNEDT